MRIERYAQLARHTFDAGQTGVTYVDVELAGTHATKPFAARVRYSRTWTYDDAHGWQVLAATSGPLAADAGTHLDSIGACLMPDMGAPPIGVADVLVLPHHVSARQELPVVIASVDALDQAPAHDGELNRGRQAR